MTKERCIELIKKRINDIESERQLFKGNDDWYDGKRRVLQEVLELVGMIGNDKNK